MYHSTATLTPNASILIAGSNPNDDIQLNNTFPTEYRLEWLSPPYMDYTRPTYTNLPATLNYNETITLQVDIAEGAQNISGTETISDRFPNL